MKTLFRTLSLTIGIFGIGLVSYGQKTNVTNAVLEYRNLKPKLYAEGNFPEAKKSVIVAKNYIDLAAAHPETQEDQKMFLYKGEIYFALAMLIGMDPSMSTVTDEESVDISIAAYKRGYQGGGKHQLEIIEAVTEKRQMFYMTANNAWQEEMYLEAGESYEMVSRLSDAISIVDTTAIFNAGLSYDNIDRYEEAARMYEQLASYDYRETKGAILAASVYNRLGNPGRSIQLLTAAQQKFPHDRDVLLGLVNAYLAAGDAYGAEKALSNAISIDPYNEKLHYNIGAIYIDLGDQANTEANELREGAEKAEKLQVADEAYRNAETALGNALQLKPGYIDAEYQLGAHLYNWSSQLQYQASISGAGSALEQEFIRKADIKLNAAVIALERYIAYAPSDQGILKILWESYYKMGNQQKAEEYKRRYEAGSL